MNFTILVKSIKIIQDESNFIQEACQRVLLANTF